jgi:hypothetical protein
VHLTEYIRNITYLEPSKAYFDASSGKSWPQSEFETLLLYKFDLTPEKAAQVAQSIRELRSGPAPKPKASASHHRKVDRRAALERAYKSLKPALRLYRADERLSVALFAGDERGEILRRGELSPQRFTEILVNSGSLLARLNSALKEEPDLAELTATDLAQSLYKIFCSDLDTLIHGKVPQLAFDRGPAFRVLDSSLIKPGTHPTWDQFLCRLSHPETFKAYVWSIFEPSNETRQVLWLQGSGNDGKSSVINAIADFYGRHAVLSLGDTFADSPFFYGSAYGKQFAIYMDCNNTQIIRHNRIKSLTGGDTVEINEKFQTAFSARIYAKLIVSSNFNPSIDINEAAERTRLLLIRVYPLKNNELGDSKFAPGLQAEIGHFLYSCKVAYASQCPTGMNLIVPPDMAEDIEASCTSDETNSLDEFLQSELEFGPDYFVSRSELLNAFMRFSANNWARSEYRMVHLVRRLTKIPGVQSRRLGGETARVRGFSGVRLKTGELSKTVHVLAKKGSD